MYKIKNKIKNIFFVLLVLSFSQKLEPATIGSDSSVYRFTTQQTLYDGDRIAFFAGLEDGFKINNANSSIEFDSTFPVSGQVNMAMGTIALTQDLIFGDNSDWYEIGHINGNNNKLSLSPSISSFPSGAKDNTEISLITNALQTEDVKTCKWSFDNKFVAVGLYSNSGTHNTLLIYEFDGSTLTFKDSVNLQNMTVYDVAWHPSDYLVSAIIEDAGYDMFCYEVIETTGTLTFKSQIYLTGNGYAVDWHPAGNWLAVGGTKTAQELRIFSVDESGVINGTQVATYNTDATVQERAVRWNNSGDYLALGLASAATNELIIFEFNQGTQTLTVDTTKNIGYDVRALSWNKNFPEYLAIGLAGSSERLRIYKFDSGASTLVQVASTNLGVTVTTIEWGKAGNCLYVGSVNDASQKELTTYSFDTTTHALEKINSFNFAEQVNNISCSPNNNYIAVGTNTNELYIYDACCPEIPAIFTNLNLVINGNTQVKAYTIIFNGNCSIKGNGNTLQLSPSCTLIVDSNATLLLKDIIINDVYENHIKCVDNTSTIQLENCTWQLSDNYTFTTGKLNITEDFFVTGENKEFSYQSSAQSTIQKNGKLILGNNLTFDYNPPVSNNQLISLTNPTSKIILNGANLHASYGLQLTKGILELSRNARLSSDGTLENISIIFGDGTNSANNLNIKLRPGATINVTGGNVINKNI